MILDHAPGHARFAAPGRSPSWKKASLLVLFAVCTIAAAQTTDKEWQTKAIQKYPALGVQGSDLNKRFVAEHNQRRKASPAFFTNPKWPLILADELAATPPPKPPASDTLPARLLSTWNELSDELRVVFGLCVGTMALGISLAVILQMRSKRRWKRICAEAETYLASLDDSTGFPTVPAGIMLQPNERPCYHAPSALYETRAVRHYQSGFAGFRVAPGIWVGGSRGRSVSSQEWMRIDVGTLIVTNQRIVFDGGREHRTLPLRRILSVNALHDSVDLALEGREKSMVFEAANPLILASIIRLSCQGYDDVVREPAPSEHAQFTSASGAARNRSGTAASEPPPASKPKNPRPRPKPEPPITEPDEVVHARTLGLSGTFDFAEVKRHYRDRIREYHPDKVAALGPKLRELAEAESKKINSAYEFFTKKFRTGRTA